MAFERECRSCELMLWYAERQLAEIPDAQFHAQPSPGVNTPAWILGHLANTADHGLQRLGRAPLNPPAWDKIYGQGSDPASTPQPPPTKAQLEDALRRTYTEFIAALRAADEAALSQQPFTSETLKDSPLKTMADVLTHLATSHFAAHLGQLATWRRCMGYKAMF